MKAFLLAAGLGTRLKPITDKIPKCLVEINNKPLLGWWVKLADNLTNYNLTEFLNFHREKKQPFSMALFNTDKPSACRIALMNEESIIIDFEEKPKQPKSNLANAGLYIASPEVLDLIPNYELIDIGFHLLPQLVNKMSGWRSNDYLIDIGTIQNLEKANNEWSKIIGRNSNKF